MSKRLQKLLFFWFLLLLIQVQTLLAQAKFTATISPPSIGKNETAELRLMIENASQAGEITLPSLKDFIVLSGPNQESGMENNNGITKQYTGVTYILKPRAPGNFTIGPATVKADGKILQTSRVSVKVSNQTVSGNQQNNNSSPFSGLSFFDEPVQQTYNSDFILKKGENIQEKISKNMFIKATPDRTNCYIGEPVVVTYKLYTRLKSESSITKNPYFNGFSVIDLIQPGSTSYDIENFNGRQYNVYTLRKAQLYPLQAGAMEAESAEVENTIHFVKEEFIKNHPYNGSDLLDGLPPEAMQDEKVTLQSKPVIINVKALPDTNKPASFKGAVGTFNIETSVEKNNFSTDDAGKLKVVITGRGNMELINAPEINWPGGIESFEPVITESLDKEAVPVSGNKSFEFPFTVVKPGTYILPAVEYSYFDAGVKTYKTAATKPVKITVTKGTGKPPAAKNNGADKTNKEQFFDVIFNNRFLIIVPVALIMFAGLFYWIKKESKNENAALKVVNFKTAPVVKEPENIILNPLANTEQNLVMHNSKGFYEALSKEIREFLAAQLNVTQQAINKKYLAEALDNKAIDVNISLQVQQLINEVEWQLYTPFADENKMEEMYQSATNIVHYFTANTLGGIPQNNT